MHECRYQQMKTLHLQPYDMRQRHQSIRMGHAITGHTYHLPVCMISFIVPVDIQTNSLHTACYKHCEQREYHANHHTDTK